MLPASCLTVSCSQVWNRNFHNLSEGETSSSPIHHRCILIKARMLTCSVASPPLLLPTPSDLPHPTPLGSLGRQRAITMVIWIQIPHTLVHCDWRVLRWEGTKCQSNRFFTCFCFCCFPRRDCAQILALTGVWLPPIPSGVRCGSKTRKCTSFLQENILKSLSVVSVQFFCHFICRVLPVVVRLRTSVQKTTLTLYNPRFRSCRNVWLPELSVVKLVAHLKEPPWPRVLPAPSLFVLLP